MPMSSWRMRRRSPPSVTAAAREGRAPRLAQLLDQWGGVTIAYRRRLIDSPSYTLNHEEVAKAMEEAVRFAEGLTPRAVEVDEFGHAAGLRVSRADGSEITLPARAILVAAGTQPNTVLAREDGRIRLDGRYFEAIDETGSPVERGARPRQAGCDARADASRRQRPLHQLLRRSASKLLRQCRQGDGRRQARLSRRVSRACGARCNADHGRRTDRALSAGVCADRACGASADTEHRGGGGACAGAGARISPGSVLSAAELRDAGAAHRGGWRVEHCSGDGRPGDDRRLDRPRAGPGRR